MVRLTRIPMRARGCYDQECLPISQGRNASLNMASIAASVTRPARASVVVWAMLMTPWFSVAA